MNRILFTAVVAALMMTGCTHSPHPSASESPSEDDFRMMIRLWPAHHDDTLLTGQLLEAFRKYDFCDEVWLCTNDPMSHSLSWHEPHAKAMGIAAQRFRDAGIITSMQGVALGHGDGVIVGSNPSKDSTIRWGTMVGPDGIVTGTVNCPRQPDYLSYMERAFAPYVREVHPHSLYLDDDLRITQHPPATEGCFCDDCIAGFNEEFGHSFTRKTLVAALASNQDDGKIRSEWIAYCQESLAGIVRAISRGVHKVSPETRMGLQHANFHRKLLEGWDWNPMFRAMEEETGLTPVSRPGHGYYNDHAPRGMIEKGLGIARQIRRLEPGITQIAPEIEGYVHKATGKSPKSLGIETMYYLSLGATQMSYAIICGNQEPISWYADNYFKVLAEYKHFAKEYASFNKGTVPAGIDPYISRDLVFRDVEPGEDSWAWATTDSGSQAFPLAAIGFPFAPEAADPLVRMLDEEEVRGASEEELRSLLVKGGIVVDAVSWKRLEKRGLTEGFTDTSIAPDPKYSGAVKRIRFMQKGEARLAVVPSYSDDINGAARLAMLHAFDWASGERLPAVLESFAQTAVVPRVDQSGLLRSVALLNCCISDQENYILRLRTGDPKGSPIPDFVWKRQGMKDIVLKPVREGEDIIVNIPLLEDWSFGWIALERKTR